MPNDDKKLKAHVFVCTNTRPTGDSCGARGGTQLRDQLKALCAQDARGLKGKMRINAAGCLGHCEEGIVAVIYPQEKWLTKLSSDDTDVLIQEVEAACRTVK